MKAAAISGRDNMAAGCKGVTSSNNKRHEISVDVSDVVQNAHCRYKNAHQNARVVYVVKIPTVVI